MSEIAVLGIEHDARRGRHRLAPVGGTTSEHAGTTDASMLYGARVRLAFPHAPRSWRRKQGPVARGGRMINQHSGRASH